MDPLTLTSSAVTLSSMCAAAMSHLYRRWADSSRPTSERLLREISRVRTLLQNIELVAVQEQMIIVNGLQEAFQDTERVLTELLERLDGDRRARECRLETRNPYREGKRLPFAHNIAASYARRLFLCFNRLKEQIAHIPALQLEAYVFPFQSSLESPLWHVKADYESAHESAQARYMKGTGKWLFDDSVFIEWLNVQRTNNVLYCPGAAGTGKTVLASAVINFIREVNDSSSEVAVTFFYFKHDTHTPVTNAAVALLEQLYLQSPTFAEEVTLLEETSRVKTLSLGDILPVLFTVASRFQKCYIILDALDECASEHERDLDALLTSLAHSSYRLFATSRPGFHFPSTTISQIQVAATPKDIDVVLRNHLSSSNTVPGFIRQSQKLTQRLRDALVMASGGRFLFATLLLNSLLQCSDERAFEAQLESSVSSLEQAYDEAIARIASLPHSYQAIAWTALTWAYYAQRPLTTKEMVDVCHQQLQDIALSAISDAGLDTSNIESLLSICMELLVRNSANDTVSFTHLTVREYLANRYMDMPPHQEDLVAGACLSLLLDQKQTRAYYPYAATFWVKHVRHMRNIPPRLQASITQFLQNERALLLSAPWLFPTNETSGGNSYATREIGAKQTTWMHVAALLGLPFVFESLAHKMADVDQRDSWGRTALHISCEQGSISTLNFLLSHGANPSLLDNDQRNAYHYAAMQRDRRIMNTLGQKGLNGISAADLAVDVHHLTPLDHAARQGGSEVLEEILMLHKAALGSTSIPTSALKNALFARELKSLEILVEYGAQICAEHLIQAAGLGFEDAVEFFLTEGLDVDAIGQTGISALHMAIDGGKHAALRVLLMGGAETELQSQGLTPLAYAVIKQDAIAVRELISDGAVLKTFIGESETATEYANRKGLDSIFRLLTRGHSYLFRSVSSSQDSNAEPFATLETRNGVPDALSSGANTLPVGQAEWGEKPIYTGIVIAELETSVNPTEPASSKAISMRAPYQACSDAAIENPRTQIYGKVSRNAGSGRAFFMLLTYPAMPQGLPLGTIVSDPADPLSSSLLDASLLSQLQAITFGHFDTQKEADLSLSQNQPQLGARALFERTPRRSIEYNLARLASTCVRETLTDYHQVVPKILELLKKPMSDRLLRGKRAFLVVGRIILFDDPQQRLVEKPTQMSDTQQMSSENSVGFGPSTTRSLFRSSSSNAYVRPGEVVYAVKYLRLAALAHRDEGKLAVYADGYHRGSKEDGFLF